MTSPSPKRRRQGCFSLTRSSSTMYDRQCYANSARSSGSMFGHKAWETITLDVDKWQPNQVEQLSDLKSIGGYPWRLRLLKRDDGKCELFVRNEKSSESELWECRADVRVDDWTVEYKSNSWTETHEQRIFVYDKVIDDGTYLEVEIKPDEEDSDEREIEWRCRPVLDRLERQDGVLLIGEAKEKIYVHRQFLASLSPFFDRLFNGDKNMTAIPIVDVDHKELANVIRMVYGFDDASLTDDDVETVLEIANKFDLKIVEDKAVTYLLSTSSSLTIREKVSIAEDWNLSFLKDNLILQYSKADLKELYEDEDLWDSLSKETTRAIVAHVCSNLDD